jgi:hypothetical protein
MTVSEEELRKTFDLMFNNPPLSAEEEANAAAYDAEQAANAAAVQDAYNRFIAGTNDLADALALEKAGLVEAIYDAADSERPVAWRLRKVDGNEYTDQTGIEEKPIGFRKNDTAE